MDSNHVLDIPPPDEYIPLKELLKNFTEDFDKMDGLKNKTAFNKTYKEIFKRRIDLDRPYDNYIKKCNSYGIIPRPVGIC